MNKRPDLLPVKSLLWISSPILCLGLTSPLPSRPPYLAARFLRPGQIICSEKLSTAQCDVVTNVHCEGGLPWGKSVVERCRTNYVRHVPPQGCVTAIQGLSFLLGEAYTHNV